MTTSFLSTTNDALTSSYKDVKDNNWAETLLKLKTATPNNKPVGLDALAVLCSSAISIHEEERPVRRERSISNPEGMEKWDALGRLDCRVPPSILEEPNTTSAEEDMTEVASSLSLLARDRSMPAIVTPEETADDPTELLKKARTKLLEDIHECGNGKGLSILPHTLSKYREVYNKNGRIGIYTPVERQAILVRFHGKRTRRVWNKRIRYSCRKNLADRRLRVKGRFVKRSSEEAATALAQVAVTPTRPLLPAVSEMEGVEENLPDTNDIEAGFDPTLDQPFRRARRHTIT